MPTIFRIVPWPNKPANRLIRYCKYQVFTFFITCLIWTAQTLEYHGPQDNPPEQQAGAGHRWACLRWSTRSGWCCAGSLAFSALEAHNCSKHGPKWSQIPWDFHFLLYNTGKYTESKNYLLSLTAASPAISSTRDESRGRGWAGLLCGGEEPSWHNIPVPVILQSWERFPGSCITLLISAPHFERKNSPQ